MKRLPVAPGLKIGLGTLLESAIMHQMQNAGSGAKTGQFACGMYFEAKRHFEQQNEQTALSAKIDLRLARDWFRENLV
jgi:hypothetical protein